MQNNAGFKNKLELWDRTKNKYDWENEDLDVSDGKVEVEPVNAYPHIPAEIPGVLMEYDLQPDEGAVQENPIPNMSYLAAAAHANAGLAPTPGVSQTTVDDNDDEDGEAGYSPRPAAFTGVRG